MNQPRDTRQYLWPERFAMLDGWRGVAAIAVVFVNITHVNVGRPMMLFFVISGYGITAVAESYLRQGLGFRAFMWRRLHRMYPPYFFSLVFFIIMCFFKISGNELNYAPLKFIQNVTLTQWLTMLRHPIATPSANPRLFVDIHWTICYMFQFYIVIALTMIAARVLRIRLLWPILTLIGIGLMWNIHWNMNLPTLYHGLFIEFWVHFGIGCILFYRLCRIKSVGACRLIDGLLLILAITSLLWYIQTGQRSGRLFYNQLLVVSVFALVLVATRPMDEWFKRSSLGAVLRGLGSISYSLYLIHAFNIDLVSKVLSGVLPARTPEPVSVAAQVAALVALATVFWYLCERPFLNKRRQYATHKIINSA